ncbi:MAG: transposase [Anaerolineae bacterium]
MTETRRQFTGEQKIAVLRRHLLEHVAVPDLCDEYGIQPSVFYRWQQ